MKKEACVRKSAFLALVVVALFCPRCLADQIILVNGDQISGKIGKADGKSLTINSEFAGVITVQWGAIEQISSERPLHLTLKDDQIIVGAVSTTAGKIEVQTCEAGAVTLSKDSIRALRSMEEQAAYRAEMDRLRNPGMLDLWSGSVDAGLSLARGNADTTTSSLALNASRSTARDKTNVHAAMLYATDQTTGESRSTANATRGGVRYDIKITDRHFAFGSGDLEFDEFQQLDLRMVLGGGLGWHVKKTERFAFDLFGGGSFNREYFSTGLRRNSGEILIGQELSHKLSSRVSLKERAVIFHNLNETGEYRLNIDASALTKLNQWLGWHVTLSDRFLSNPVPGAKKNGLLLTTGIRLTFER
jgi:putative salt-induced outer membrane protein